MPFEKYAEHHKVEDRLSEMTREESPDRLGRQGSATQITRAGFDNRLIDFDTEYGDGDTRAGYPLMDKDKGQASKMWTPPVVDMADPSAPTVISKACKDTGMFYLENHGVPEEMIDHVFDRSKAFFDLDVEVKMAVKLDENNRGYRSMGKEMVNKDNQSKGDTKEAFDIWRDLDPEKKEDGKPLSGPNQWPPERSLPGFKLAMTNYFNNMHALAERVMVLLAAGDDVDPIVFTGSLSETLSVLRLLHYSPEVSNPGEGVFGIGEHSDFGILTILTTDEPGLQILHDGDWVDVPPRPGAFICNLGDMLQRWSNDNLQSTVHRVVNKLGRERYSIPFFVIPNFDTEVACLPQFCSEDDPAKYPPTTSGIFLLEKFTTTYSEKDNKEAVVS